MLRLFGRLGARELQHVVDAVVERARSPRDLVCIVFEDVEHLDYRALSGFAEALARHRNRGASIWFVGLSPYLRCLFQVAGQGPLARQLEWRAAEDPEPPLVDHGGEARAGASRGRIAWGTFETVH